MEVQVKRKYLLGELLIPVTVEEGGLAAAEKCCHGAALAGTGTIYPSTSQMKLYQHLVSLYHKAIPFLLWVENSTGSFNLYITAAIAAHPHYTTGH